MYPFLEEITSYAHKKGLEIYITTNWIQLADSKFLEKTTCSHYTVSIQATDPATHDTITQVPWSFEKTMQGIENCLRNNTDISIAKVVAEKNIDKYLSYIDFFYKKWIRFFSFISHFPWFWEKEVWETIPSPEEQAKIFEEIFHHTKKYKDAEFELAIHIPLCLFKEKILKEMTEAANIHFSSFQTDLFFGTKCAITPNGDITPTNCYSWVTIWNIRTNKNKKTVISAKRFMQRWNGKAAVAFRKLLRHYPAKKCESCPLREKRCHGGEPLLRQAYPIEAIIEKKGEVFTEDFISPKAEKKKKSFF